MQSFRILHFKDNVLERADELVARDLLEAIEHASGQAADITVEVWSEQRRVAVVGPAPKRRRRDSATRGRL